MGGEFSFAELVQACQSRKMRGGFKTSIVPSTEAISNCPRDPPSVQPSIPPSGSLTVPAMPSVRVEVIEPSIPLLAVPVLELSSDDEPIALRRRGKRPVIVDPEKVPLRTRPHTSKPKMSKDQTMSLPLFFHGTSVRLFLHHEHLERMKSLSFSIGVLL